MQALSPEKRAPAAAGRAAAPTGPFVGPGPFTEAQRDLFFGRDTDVSRLRSLLRTERIVVLHSPSGAGKTSLIQAGLVPRLRDGDDFRIFPTIRVGQELPESDRAPGAANRYAYSAVHSLESGFAGEAEDEDVRDADELLGIRLSTYFAHRDAVHGRGCTARLLIFDQFEELFTRSPHDHRARIEFFTDLAKVLRDRSIWALFAMREEYVAALDRYKRLLPAQLSARFHLDLLTPSGARQAVSRPAEKVGVTVHDDALELIIGDLAKAAPNGDRPDVDGSGSRPEPDAGVIDPLHLQLLCVDVWKQLPADTREIDHKTIRRLRAGERRGAADLSAVDWALLRYCDETLPKACRKAVETTSGKSREPQPEEDGLRGRQGVEKACQELERRIRYWIDDHLIEAEGYRRQTIAEKNDPLLREAQASLEDDHILRANVRLGTKWYEIAHDRMVAPLRRSNDRWYDLHHDRFQRLARRYHEEKYPQQFDYLTPQELEDEGYGKNLSRKDHESLQEHERRYLSFCRQRARTRRRRIAVAGAAVLALAIGAIVIQEKLENAYMGSIALSGKIERQKNELAELEKKGEDTVKRGQVRQLYSSAMTQRYRWENHDVALLLTKLALGISEKSPGVRPPDLRLDAPFWAAMEADPFSQTVPRDVLGGRPGLLAAVGGSVWVTVEGPGTGETGLVEIDTAAHRLELAQPCAGGTRSLTPDQRLAVVVEGRLEIVEVADGKCRILAPETAGGPEFRSVAPVWSPDRSYLAAFAADGVAAVYRAGDGHLTPLEPIPPRPREGDDGESGDPYQITAAAFREGMVAVGDEGGGVRFASLTGSEDLPQEFTVWEEYWPYGKDLGHPAATPADAGIVAMRFLSVRGPAPVVEFDERGPEAADEVAETWLCLVHRGSYRTKGGKIFLHRLADPTGPRYEMIADDDSRIREQTLRQLGRSVERPAGEVIESASFSSDGAWLVTAGASGTVTRWDLRDFDFSARSTPDEVGHQPPPAEDGAAAKAAVPAEIDYPVARARRDLLRGARGRVAGVAVTKNGGHVAAIQRGAAVRLWHFGGLSAAYRLQPWREVGYLNALAFDSENRLITTHNRGRVQSWRVGLEAGGCGDGSSPAGSRTQLCIEEDGLFEARLSPPGDRKKVSILSLDVGKDLLVLGVDDPDPRLLAPASGSELTLTVPRSRVRHAYRVSAAAFRPANPDLEERYDLVTGDGEGTLILWDLAGRSGERSITVESVAAIDLGGTSITGLDFHPAGRWLAVAKLRGPLDLVDLAGASCAVTAPEGPGEPCVAHRVPVFLQEIRSLAFNEAGDRLAAGGDSLAWWRFDAGSGDPLSEGEKRVAGATGNFYAIAFLPGREGTLAATAEGSVQIWTLDRDGWPFELRGDGVELRSLAVSPDGGLVAAGDARGRFMVWDMNVSDYVCHLTMRDLTAEEWGLYAPRGMERERLCGEPPSGPARPGGA